jgi:hypothetical protein
MSEKRKHIIVYSTDHALLNFEKIKREKTSIADTLREILKEWVEKR